MQFPDQRQGSERTGKAELYPRNVGSIAGKEREPMDDEIKKLQSKIIELKDVISQQGTRARYVKTLIEQILNDYFMNPNPEMEEIYGKLCVSIP